ncbi:MAG: nucleotide exchange factor GrpE, partial [Anaerolineae bacterium]
RIVRIPVRVKGSGGTPSPDPHPPTVEETMAAEEVHRNETGEPAAQGHEAPSTPPAPEPSPTAEAGQQGDIPEGSLEWWRDRALRLQAEMENFRKRQQRLAEEQIRADRERVLRAFLKVADDLERALQASEADPERLREGVRLIYQTFLNLLEKEGVRRVEAAGKPFDPTLHEAVTAVQGQGEEGAEPRVVEVIEPGYTLGDRLLRPAKVVVSR